MTGIGQTFAVHQHQRRGRAEAAQIDVGESGARAAVVPRGIGGRGVGTRCDLEVADHFRHVGHTGRDQLFVVEHLHRARRILGRAANVGPRDDDFLDLAVLRTGRDRPQQRATRKRD